MTDLTPDHPAVEALADAIYRALSGQYGDFGTPSKGEAHAALTAALPHLTADDLRDTPAGHALMAEGWAQATLWVRYRDGRWPQDMEDANPYRKDDA